MKNNKETAGVIVVIATMVAIIAWLVSCAIPTTTPTAAPTAAIDSLVISYNGRNYQKGEEVLVNFDENFNEDTFTVSSYNNDSWISVPMSIYSSEEQAYILVSHLPHEIVEQMFAEKKKEQRFVPFKSVFDGLVPIKDTANKRALMLSLIVPVNI